MRSRIPVLAAVSAPSLIVSMLTCSKKSSAPTAPADWPALTAFLLVTRGPATPDGFGQLLRQNLATGAFETLSGTLRAPCDVLIGPDGKTYVLENWLLAAARV